jgi:hypothetical protein
MDRRQTNRITMFKTTALNLRENQSVWGGMTLFADAVQRLNDLIASLDNAAQTQQVPITGATVDKASARDALEDVLFLVCEALGVLGHTGHDNDLVALVDLTPASLHRLGEEEISHRAATILDRANARKTELAALHVTQANLDELTQALEDYNTSKQKPREAVAVRSAETGVIPALIRQISDVLRNEIDPMVNLFRRSDGKFVKTYRTARVIVDRAASHASPPPPKPPTPPTP